MEEPPDQSYKSRGIERRGECLVLFAIGKVASEVVVMGRFPQQPILGLGTVALE